MSTDSNTSTGSNSPKPGSYRQRRTPQLLTLGCVKERIQIFNLKERILTHLPALTNLRFQHLCRILTLPKPGPHRQRRAPQLAVQHLGHGAVGELELPLVVELEEDGAVRVAALDVQEVLGGVLRCAAAVLAHVQLGSPLLVAEGKALAVHLALVRLQAAALGEGLAAVTLEGLDAWGQDRQTVCESINQCMYAVCMMFYVVFRLVGVR